MGSIPRIEGLIGKVRGSSPLVHHLTNLVTMNDCANATLAIGASPVMSASELEAPELAALASALVINMGTPDDAQVRSMLAAARVARERCIPIVFDPVGAGATEYRRKLSVRLLDQCGATIVKGNAAEIAFLAGLSSSQRGVDSLEGAEAIERTARAAVSVARRASCVVVATGAIDVVADSGGAWTIEGGCPELGRICGSGCMEASVAASLAAVASSSGARSPGTCSSGALEAAISASLVFKLAGEAALSSPSAARGLSSFRWAFMDALSMISDEALDAATLSSGSGGRCRHVRL